MISSNDFSKKQILVLLASQGDKLSFQNDNVVVKDKSGHVKHQSTCYRLFSIFILGNLSITTGLIQRSRKFGFSIVLFSTTFKVYQIIGGKTFGNTILNKKQYSYEGNDIARQITLNKMINQQYALKQIRYKNEYIRESIDNISEYISNLNETDSIQQIMGVEGNTARIYFKSFFNNVVWNGRKPRTKIDMINSLLDIGYTILFNYVEAIISIYGFDLYVGVLHRNFYMRKSLVCDLVEPFRVIIDIQTKKSINLKQFKEEDFKIYNKRWELSWDKSADYTSIYLKAILEYKDDIFKYIQSYYRCFMKQLPIEQYPLFLLEDHV